MERLGATSELQSRLSSLSVSSFPGITSKNCLTTTQERLQSTDLSQHSHITASLPQMDDSKGLPQSSESNEGDPSEQTMDGETEVSNTNEKGDHPEDGKAALPLLKPPSTWTSLTLKELKTKLRQEKDSMVTVYRGDVMTVHVPTVPEAKRVCWEFATDGYDIGFGIYFDWTPVTSRAITVHISESSDDEDDDEELEGPVSPGDIEKGSKSSSNSNLGEILPVYRQDSHLAVQAGSHEFPVSPIAYATSCNCRCLYPNNSCLIWEGAWRLDLLTETIEKAEKGVYGKVLLTVCGEVKASFTSSTPMLSRKRLASDWLSGQQEDPFPNMHHSGGNQVNAPNSQNVEKCVTYADLKCSKSSTKHSPLLQKQRVWPTDKTPRRTVIGTRGQLTWSSEELGSSQDSTLTSSSKKRKMRLVSVTQSDEEKPVVKLKKKCRAVCPSKRWSQTMCLSDPETAILIGGEVTGHSHCKDSFWKLEIENNFWFPMDFASGPTPPCSRGHSATYDHESKLIYVYGGLSDDQRYGDVYVLNTLTWKWKLLAAKGSVPTLAYHSATIYKKELFVFGGVHPSRAPGGKACSNTLYIFNPEYEL
ncbi:hypothetical protein AGOR_G00107140 [Albula goreensis]|uniref:GOLD domain-containing protein n=1 Tax=Albula goreensis TaxID=1534307 RepID=A0A8T3DI50_9TELE|nr:hypothetical protein AGOR_G00107140 [Albula goreensis]